MSLVACRRVGALLLKGEWQEAVSTIMQPRGAAEATEVSEARRLYCDHGVRFVPFKPVTTPCLGSEAGHVVAAGSPGALSLLD